MRRISLAPALALALLGSILHAQTTQPDNNIITLPSVVVSSPYRLDTPAAQVGSSVTVIDRQQMDRQQITTVADALRQTQSVDVVRSGGPNQITSVFMRGGNSNQTLVLIDGIPVNDPTSPNGAFDFSNLTLDNVDHVEVLRGPQSTLWGGNAMGGVINIVTKRGFGPPSGSVFAEAGWYSTYREGGNVSGGTDRYNYSFSLSQADSHGFSAADKVDGNREPDGFDNTTLAGQVGFTPTQNFSLNLIGRVQTGLSDIDNHGGLGGDNPDRELRYNNLFFKIAPHFSLFDGKWEQDIGLSYSRYSRRDTGDAADPFDGFSDTYGGLLEAQWQNNLHLFKDNTITLGEDFQHQSLNSNSVQRVTADSIGLYAQDEQTFWDKLFLSGGLRYDHNSVAGSDVTYRGTAAYLFPTHSKLHASYGTGFRPPSLFELFSPFGNPDLQAEKSRGWDVGVEQSLLNDNLVIDVTYFRNDFHDLVDFDFVTSKSENIGSARTQGIEVGITDRINDQWSAALAYTYTDTHNLDTGKELLRRAPHKVEFDLNYDYRNKLDVTLSGVYYSKRDDIEPTSPFATVSNSDYTLVNLAASYKLDNHWTIYGRIDNLLDKKYQEVLGFGTERASLYGGVKYSF